MVVEAKADARVLPQYARILGVSQGRAQREASEAARACLVAMRFRFPGALYLVELVIRLGEVGAVDLAGTVSQIAKMIGEILGEPPPDVVKLQRSLRALEGRTCLVKNVTRLRWRLCLAGISDPGSERHRDLLKETPIPLRLGAAAEPRRDQRDADAGAEVLALRQRLEENASKLREAEAERDVARAAQADLEHQLRAARADVERLSGEVERLRGEREGAEAAGQDQRTTLEVLRDELVPRPGHTGRPSLVLRHAGCVARRSRTARYAPSSRLASAAEPGARTNRYAPVAALEQRVREQETALGLLREQIAARDGEFAAEREFRRLAEETRALEVAALEDAMKAQAAAAAAERRQLEELVLDREVALEDMGRQLAEQRSEVERIGAGANARVQAAESAAAEEAKKTASLKASLKDERERRRATESQLRRLEGQVRQQRERGDRDTPRS